MVLKRPIEVLKVWRMLYALQAALWPTVALAAGNEDQERKSN